MSAGPRYRIGAIARLSLGLVAMVVSMLLAAELLLGSGSSRDEFEKQARQRLGEAVAIQVAALLETGNSATLTKTLQQVVGRNEDVASMAIRRIDGSIVAQGGDHTRHWVAPPAGRSTIDRVRVPVHANGKHWADVEVAFLESGPRDLRGWLAHPTVRLLGIVIVGGFVLFYFYLKRVMHILDPSGVVPERVQRAFDVLTAAVVVLDVDGRIVLANQSFRRLHPEAASGIAGRQLAELPWLRESLGGCESQDLPWSRAMRDAEPVSDEPLTISRPGQEPAETIVGCAPILDGHAKPRGCIVTFDDVTEVHRKNEQLQRALDEIERSREQIRVQNSELQRLATRDPLTGCFNRRAFSDMAGRLFGEALRTGSPLSCIMADIDYFKRFNDSYGHATGDQVIQVFARSLGTRLRNADLLCRYGGEEFCMLLPGAALEQAVAIAERMRLTVETECGKAVRDAEIDTVTSSFGVSAISDGAQTLDELIDQADSALYASKDAGRNRVTASLAIVH